MCACAPGVPGMRAVHEYDQMRAGAVARGNRVHPRRATIGPAHTTNSL